MRHAEAEVRAVIHPKRKDDKHYEDFHLHGLGDTHKDRLKADLLEFIKICSRFANATWPVASVRGLFRSAFQHFQWTHSPYPAWLDTAETQAVRLSGADTITEYAQKNGMDLIVMATHGHTGFKKLMLGSVAFGVLQESHVPVLIIRPEACRL